MEQSRPVVGLVLGDATGIGPEVCARVLSTGTLRQAARLVVIGDGRVLRRGAADAGVTLEWQPVDRPEAVDWSQAAVPVIEVGGAGSLDPDTITRGKVSAEAGRAAGAWLAHATTLALGGSLDALTYAPLNKAALNAGGWRFPDDLHLVSSLIASRLGAKPGGGSALGGGLLNSGDPPPGELNVLEELWTSRVTSHVPLRDVAAQLTLGSVLNAIRLLDGALRRAGRSAPRLAVAALNPHAGDSGLCGDEEQTVIGPALAQARAAGVGCDGPFAADTIFLRARTGAYDGVVSMYHDQGQIATKLLGFNRGVTVLAGLPVVFTTPAHGTAHDIVGQGRAHPGALEQALRLAARMAAS